MVKLPSEKQRRIIKSKVEGKTNRAIGKVEYPNAKQGSQDVMVSRELKKPEVALFYEQTKLIALKEHNISWTRVMQAVSDGLDSEKIDVRLRAAKQASDYLDIPNKSVEDNKELLNNLPSNVSELEVQRLLFKTKD